MSQKKLRLDALSCYKNATEAGGSARLALTNPQLVFAASAANINRRLLPVPRTKGRKGMDRLPPNPVVHLPESDCESESADNGQQAADYEGDYTVSDSELLAMAEGISPAMRTTPARKRPLSESPPVIYLSDDDDDDDLPGPSNAYGLVEKPRHCYFDDLPNEIVRKILAPLPMLDLLFIVNRVSRRLHEIISKDDFLKWKRLYYKYRYVDDCPEVEDEVDDILATEGMSEPSTNLVASLLFVHRNYRKTLLPTQQEEMFSRLRGDRLFGAARTFVDEKVWPKLRQKPSAWVYLCAAMLLTEDSLSGVALLRRLIRSPTVLDVAEVVECCYLLALLLLVAQRTLSSIAAPATSPPFQPAFVFASASASLDIRTTLSLRWHYKIVSALYFFENGGGRGYDELKTKAAMSGQLSMHQFVQTTGSCGEGTIQKRLLTHEQYRIVSNDLAPNDCVRIVAFAGTGKTTTLLEYVRARPSKKFLVLMFNKDVCEEASHRFPPNAHCMTTHSLAYSYMVPGYGGRLVKLGAKYSGKFGFKLKTTDAVRVLPSVKGMNSYKRAKHAIAALENFLHSNDDTITIEHSPQWDQNDDGQTVQIPILHKQQYVRDAQKLWDKMKETSTTDIRMLHDGYMKLFQLANPVITTPSGEPYDAILIDEAQDMNPAILDVIRKQRQSPRMFVGDPNQQIYSFRGAINAFEEMKESTTKTFYLTQSFRFGPEIAFIGSCWLNIVKNESCKMLIGCEKKSRVDGEKHRFGPICIIARYNSTIFEHAETIATKMQNKRLSIVGGLERLELDQISDLYQLMLPAEERGAIKSKFLQKFHFNNLDDVLEYGRKVLDQELVGKVNQVRNFGHRIPLIVERIRACHVSKSEEASYLLTTTHRAKGMEFDTVLLADDFGTLEEMRRHRGEAVLKGVGDDDEFNLLYVALTRAKYSLIMNRSLLSFLNTHCSENFLQIDSTKTICDMSGEEEGGPVQLCDHCRSPLEAGDDLVLLRPQMKEPSDLNEIRVQRTVWCHACVFDTDKILAAVREPVPPLQPTLPFNPSMKAFRTKNDCNRQWIKPLFEKVVR